MNSDGEVLREFDPKPAEPGHDLRLSLDLDVQRIAEEELLEGIENARTVFDESSGKNLAANAGAVVVLDPKTGGIVAMASWPTYPPLVVRAGAHGRPQRFLLFQSAQAPMLNRATQITYAPGSTFKPFVALAAVKEGIASLGGYYDCPAEYVHEGDESGTVFHNWDGQSSGALSIAARSQGLVRHAVLRSWGSRLLLPRRGTRTSRSSSARVRQWGFGRDRPASTCRRKRSGTVPDRDYVAEHDDVYPDGWIPGIDILLAIGSGEMKATPLQVAQAYSALASGRLCRPHLVATIEDRDGRGREAASAAGAVRSATRRPSSSTSARRSASVTSGRDGVRRCSQRCPLDVSGKTGTAERPPFQDTSWFAGIVPSHDPQYVVVATVEQGGFGAETAAPIVRNIMSRIYRTPCEGPGLGEQED